MNTVVPDYKRTRLADGAIALRPYTMQDVPEVYRVIYDSLAEIGAWLPFAHEGYAIKENRDYLKKRPGEWKKGTAYEFAITDARDGRIIGGCGLNGIDLMNGRANLGYWVGTAYTGKGVATAAARLLAKWGFEVLKLNRIEILVAVGNERSLRVATKAGATREGVLRSRIMIRGKAHDAVMHSLIPGDIRPAEQPE